MRLGEYILRNMDVVLHRWGVSATDGIRVSQRSPQGSARDHSGGILRAIVADLDRPQTIEERTGMWTARPRVAADRQPTAVQAHAVLRAESGFTIEELVAEYRALRTGVLRGWIEACRPESPLVDDIVRFDQAVDAALMESVRVFSAHLSRARSLVLGMLGHDMRSPLATLKMTARGLQRLHANADVDRAAQLLVRSGARMQKLLDEQIDFSRMELGLGIGVTPHDVDLGPVCTQELEQISAAHAERPLHLEVTGDCSGAWDSGRFQQMLNNLVVNAVQYGEPREAIHVALRGGAKDVRLTVANAGETIDRETLAHIFEPMRRGKAGAARHDSGLGLGLYIASEIAKAHGGAIAAESAAHQTVFTVCLPKVRCPPVVTREAR